MLWCYINGEPIFSFNFKQKTSMNIKEAEDLFKLDRKVVDNPTLKGKEQTWELRDH